MIPDHKVKPTDACTNQPILPQKRLMKVWTISHIGKKFYSNYTARVLSKTVPVSNID